MDEWTTLCSTIYRHIEWPPVTINFSVSFNGSNPIITSSNIPGHSNAAFILVKETSSALIEGFEGTYKTTKPETGTFNMILSRTAGLWAGVARKDGSSSVENINGTITSDGKIKNDSGQEVGTLSGDQISGQSKDGNNNTVTINGKRTL